MRFLSSLRRCHTPALLTLVLLGGPALAQRAEKTAAARERARIEELAELVRQDRAVPVEGVQKHAAELLTLLAEHPNPALETRVRLDLAWALARQGDTDRALAEARAARTLAEESGDAAAAARADYHLGVAHWYRSELEEAFAAVERARSVQAQLGEDAALGTTLTLAGVMHRSRSAYDEALACHLEALEIAQRLEDADGVARARNNLGLVYWNLEQHERALEFLVPVVERHRELEEPLKLATGLNNLGLIHIELGQPEVALGYLEEGLAIHADLGLSRSKALLHGNLGFAAEALGDAEEALRYYFLSLGMHQELGDHWGSARSLGDIADVYSGLGRWDEAEDYYTRALASAETADAREEQADFHRGLSQVYAAQGRHAEALAAFQRHAAMEKELDRGGMAREIAELEARTALATQELELSRQRNRQNVLALGSLLLAAGTVALSLLYRSRARSLRAVRASHAELQRAAERLRESEQRYRSVFEDGVVPKLLLDLELRRVLDANVPAGRLCRLDPTELRGAALTHLRPTWLARALASFGEDEPRADTCRWAEWRDANGERQYAELWTTPLSLDGRPCAVVTVHDVTERHRIREERIRLDKLDSLGLLAGGIAHDFNNALVAVLGNVSLARHRAATDPVLEPLLSEAEAAIDHATHLTTQLLAFARGGAPKRELADVRQLLWDSVNFALSGSSASVEFDLAPNLWAADLDAGQFKQVISNLVINADQAMQDGGHLIVRARNLRAARALSPTAGPGAYVLVELQDNGPGIPEAIREKVLDPYFTTKESGSGLGLATVFAIVSRHLGWLEFASTPEKGTIFSLYFPASTSRSPAAQEDSQLTFEGTGSVLVMDDDPKVQSVYGALLTELGYEVDVVGDGEAALERWTAAAEAGHGYDVVIMDLTVPGGMGGKAAMAELRRRDPEALGIVASGYSKDPVMSNYREAGFAASIGKPFTIAGLGRLLGLLLRDRVARRAATGELTPSRPRSAAGPRRAPDPGSRSSPPR